MRSSRAISKPSAIAALGLATCLLVGAVDADETTLFEPAAQGGRKSCISRPIGVWETYGWHRNLSPCGTQSVCARITTGNVQVQREAT